MSFPGNDLVYRLEIRFINTISAVQSMCVSTVQLCVNFNNWCPQGIIHYVQMHLSFRRNDGTNENSSNRNGTKLLALLCYLLHTVHHIGLKRGTGSKTLPQCHIDLSVTVLSELSRGWEDIIVDIRLGYRIWWLQQIVVHIPGNGWFESLESLKSGDSSEPGDSLGHA